MIFRIDGEAGELLSITPILREWKKRNNGGKVFVETNTPDVFYGNSCVDMASISIPVVDKYYDMNCVNWHSLGASVSEVYSDMILGDRKMNNWRWEMSSSPADIEFAKGVIPDTKKPKAAVDFCGKKIDLSAIDGVVDLLVSLGYEVFDIGLLDGRLGSIREAICLSDIFIGEEGDASCISFTTNVPSIVCYSYRSPVYFPSYRVGVPFIPLLASKKMCKHVSGCYAINSLVQFSKFYSMKCVSDDKFCCMRRNLKDDVFKAIRMIGDRA